MGGNAGAESCPKWGQGTDQAGQGRLSDVSSFASQELRYVVSPASISPEGRLGLFFLELAGEPWHDLCFPVTKVSLDDMLPRFRHQRKVEGKVVDGGNLWTKQLIDPEEVMEVGFGVCQASRRCTWVCVYRAEVVTPPGVFDIDDPLPGVDHAVPCVPAGEHAVKHIYPPADALNDVGGRANAHQVAGFTFGEDVATELTDAVHVFHRLSYGEASDGVAGLILTGDKLRRLRPQIIETAALHDGEQGLGMAILWFRFCHEFYAALQPPVGEVHAVFGVLAGAGVGRAFVEGHNNVSANTALNAQTAFGAEQVLAAINVAGEGGAFFGNFAPMRKAEYLVSSAIRKNGAVPVHEPVETTGGLHGLHAGAQVKVVSIS